MHVGGVRLLVEHAAKSLNKGSGGRFRTGLGNSRIPGTGAVKVVGIFTHFSYKAFICNAEWADICLG